MKKVGEVLATQGLAPGPPGRAGGPGAAAEGAPPADACPTCKGAGWLRAEVPYGHPYFGRLFMCECLQARVEARKLRDLQRLSNLDPFKDKTFSNFDTKVPGVEKAYRAAKRFAADPQGWLVLLGGYGCGKTHLAAAIANESLQREVAVLFTTVPELLDHLRSTFAPNSDVRYDELFDSVRNSPLLILDDLGTESSTPWAQEKLYQVFNYRYNYRMPTVVTSNCPFERIDGRIRSRLSDRALSEIIEIGAPDYRQRGMGERRFRSSRFARSGDSYQ